MNRRLFLFLTVLVCMFGALLLLSALIQTPAEELQAAEETRPGTHTVTAFAGMPPTPATGPAMPLGIWLKAAAMFAAAIVILPRLHCICDANGRVLCRRSYIRSYHLVYRQEFACG